MIETNLAGVLIFQPRAFGDARGFFMETWQRERYEAAGIGAEFVQDNVSCSARGVLRGLHFQHPHSQGKLVQVLDGAVLDVAVDIRVGSPTFGESVCVEISVENHRQMYIPPGFAHGFCVLSDGAIFSYKCTDYYNGEAENGILWSDPDLNIDWPIDEPLLSDKDKVYSRLCDISRDRLPRFGGEL